MIGLRGLSLGVVIAATACGGETGILVEVTRQDVAETASIDRLRFVAGVQVEGEPGHFQLDPAGEEVSLDGRDVLVDPYRMLFRDAASRPKSFMIAVLGLAGDDVVAIGALAAPMQFADGKILEVEVVLGAPFNGYAFETGCVIWWNGEAETKIFPADDIDCDGDAAATDCDDEDSAVDSLDRDQDGITSCDGDCDDWTAEVFPDNEEVCDGLNNDCDDLCDEGFDLDGDDFTTCNSQILRDGSGGCLAAEIGDCDDEDPAAHQGHDEICDGADNDCNGSCDDGEILDADGDGFTACGTIPGVCMDPMEALGDCEPAHVEVHPFATEGCDGFDTNCDGELMVSTACYDFESGDCREGTAACDDTTGTIGECLLEIPGAHFAHDALCEAYDDCIDVEHSSTPFLCAGDSVTPDLAVSCTILHDESDALCPGRAIPILGGTAATSCAWWIYGGMIQPHYEAALSSELSPGPSLKINECAGLFHIIAKRDLWAQEDTIRLGYLDDLVAAGDPGEPLLVEIDLVPVKIDACNDATGPGLVCTSVAIP
jgi:hypothetical protein